MNKKQHFFIWIGIALITFMAIVLDSTLFWLIAAMALIGESVWLCKEMPTQISKADNKKVLILLSFIIFIIIFAYSKEIRRELPFHRHRPVPRIIAD